MRIEQLCFPQEFLLLTNVAKFHIAFLGLDIWAGAYTCRQVNTMPEKPLPLFNVVVICDIKQLNEATAALKKCFDEVEQAYWYNKSVQTGV